MVRKVVIVFSFISLNFFIDVACIDVLRETFAEIMNNANRPPEDMLMYPIRPQTACYEDLGCFSNAKGCMSHIYGVPYHPADIKTRFLIYTRGGNFEYPYIVDYNDDISPCAIPMRSRVAFWIHGYRDNGTHYQNFAKTFGLVYETVISVDWKAGARNPYNSAVLNSLLVGRQIAVFIEKLRRYRYVDPSNVHLIGWSLGGHIAGYAGNWTQDHFGFKIGRITALDPSWVFFVKGNCRVNKNDAELVDVIHSSAGFNLFNGEVGLASSAGHVDFWPNGGSNHPGCNAFFNYSCSHDRAVEFFLASFTARRQCRFHAFQCSSWDEFKNGNCRKSDTEMGYYLTKTARGNYYLKTTDKYPFCNVQPLHTTEQAREKTIKRLFTRKLIEVMVSLFCFLKDVVN